MAGGLGQTGHRVSPPDASQVQRVAEHLLKYEVITRDDFIKIVGPRPFEDEAGTHPDDHTVYAALQAPPHDAAAEKASAEGDAASAPDAK